MKPIKVACAGLTNTIYALRRYSERDGLLISSAKDDVTAQTIQAVIEHARHCTRDDCACDGLRTAALENYHPAHRAEMSA